MSTHSPASTAGHAGVTAPSVQDLIGPYATIVVDEPHPQVLRCTFNRPEVRNALNLQMVTELRTLVTRLQHADDVQVVVFTGAGDKAFVGGADISELRQRGRREALQKINGGLFRAIEQLPMPTVAAVNGYALGGGCELAMACDVRIACESAKMGQPEVALGIIPGGGATYRLAKLVGQGFARDLIFTGRRVDAAEALRMGLVQRVVADGEVWEAALDWAKLVLKQGAAAVRFSKLTMNATAEMSVDACMALESMAQAVLFDDADKQARMDKFLKRS